MADVKQPAGAGKDGTPLNPMNLTCKPVSALADVAPSKYAVVMDTDKPAAPPKGEQWNTIFVSTEDYVVNKDGVRYVTIPAGGLGIYAK